MIEFPYYHLAELHSLGNCICQEDMREGEKSVKALACGHLFHEACSFPWLKRHKTCPNCRFRVENKDIQPPKVTREEREAMFESVLKSHLPS